MAIVANLVPLACVSRARTNDSTLPKTLLLSPRRARPTLVKVYIEGKNYGSEFSYAIAVFSPFASIALHASSAAGSGLLGFPPRPF